MFRKVIFYGAITLDDSFEGDPMEIEDAEDTLQEQIETLFQKYGYNGDVTVQYEENSLNVENPKKRPERLIDANNIDWSGMYYTGAFAENLEFVLNKQKTVSPTHEYRSSRSESYDNYEDSNYDPCDGCSGALCAECLYAGD